MVPDGAAAGAPRAPFVGENRTMMQESVVIEAPPARVFPWLEDSRRVPRWVPNVTTNEELSVTPEKVGSTFRQVYEERGKPMEFQGRVTAFEQDARLGVFLVGEYFDLDVDYRLEDLGGTTRVTQTSRVVYKGFLKLFGPLMQLLCRKAAARQQQESFARLRALVLEDAAAPA